MEAENSFLNVHPHDGLSLQRANIDSVANTAEEVKNLPRTVAAPLPDSSTAPPELSLEHFSTDDPFQPSSRQLDARLPPLAPMPVLGSSAAGPSFCSIPKSSAPSFPI